MVTDREIAVELYRALKLIVVSQHPDGRDAGVAAHPGQPGEWGYRCLFCGGSRQGRFEPSDHLRDCPIVFAKVLVEKYELREQVIVKKEAT